jgi:transposase InsO family protein
MVVSLKGRLRGSVPLRHIVTRLYRPQTKGKEEGFCRILKREFFRPDSFQDLNEGREQMEGLQFEYNHLRRHGGIKSVTRFDKLQRAIGLVRQNILRHCSLEDFS